MVKIFLLIFFMLFLTISKISQDDYDENIARKMVNISAATYYVPSEDFKANRCPKCYGGFQVQKMVKDSDLLALVGYDTTIDAVVVAFRGTDNKKNKILDIKALLVNYESVLCKSCTVHHGFRDGIVALNQAGLKIAISQAIKNHHSSKIIFTGHSLGGALANLAAVQFVEDNPNHKDVRIYTLGQPRVGGKQYRKYHTKQVPHYFRLVHAKDIVPHKPVKTLEKWYKHTGVEVWYQYGMTKKNICYDPESKECSNSVGILDTDYSIDHHSSEHYLKLSVQEQQHKKKTAPEL